MARHTVQDRGHQTSGMRSVIEEAMTWSTLHRVYRRRRSKKHTINSKLHRERQDTEVDVDKMNKALKYKLPFIIDCPKCKNNLRRGKRGKKVCTICTGSGYLEVDTYRAIDPLTSPIKDEKRESAANVPIRVLRKGSHGNDTT